MDKARISEYSYQRASELEPGHSLIWIEYGTFVYMMHSFCSRVLKQDAHKLSMEKFEVLETRKDSMLELAAHCFLSANRLLNEPSGQQDDRWLTYYILGKIAEKKNDDPPVFLEHYHKVSREIVPMSADFIENYFFSNNSHFKLIFFQASLLLYENKASYPKKISYSTPLNLSVEALEVHYRIHASILKYLEQHEGKPLKKSLGLLFQQYLKSCANSAFMKYQSKSDHKKMGEDGSDSESKIVLKHPVKIVESARNVTMIEQRSNSIEEIEIIDKSKDRLEGSKIPDQIRMENRKRAAEYANDCSKRVKLSSISHLQLIQDVVALIDDLISKVCEMTSVKDILEEDVVMLTSSDENEDVKPYRERTNVATEDEKEFKDGVASSSKTVAGQIDAVVREENIQDLMDVLMKKAMEISQEETEQSFVDDDDTRKSDGRWLQNEDLSASFFLR